MHSATLELGLQRKCRALRTVCIAALTLITFIGANFGRATAEDTIHKELPDNSAITEEEAAEFAKAMVDAIYKADVDSFNRRVDLESIFDRASQMPELADLRSQRAFFKKGMVETTKRSGGMAALISAAVKQGGSFRSLRINITKRGPYVFFRLKLPHLPGLDYHQMFLTRKSDIGIVASDIYYFQAAENMTDIYHRAWLELARKSLNENAKPGEKPTAPLFGEFDRVLDLGDQVAAGKYIESLETYRKLSPTLRTNKLALLLRLRAALQVSDSEYSTAIDDMRKFGPDDHAFDLILIDSHLIRKEFEQAIQCVDRIDERVGGDAALKVVRAIALLGASRVEEARNAIKSAIAAEPDLRDSYSVGLDISLAGKNFDDTVICLNVLEQQFGRKWKDLREVPAFSDFVKSDHYAKWSEARKKQVPEVSP